MYFKIKLQYEFLPHCFDIASVSSYEGDHMPWLERLQFLIELVHCGHLWQTML